MAIRILDSHLPDVLVDEIARSVHKDNMEIVMSSITPAIQHALHRGGARQLLAIMRERFPDTEFFYDNEYCWGTAIMRLTSKHVVVYHAYTDDTIHPEICMFEGHLNEAMDKLCMKCFLGSDWYTSPHKVCQDTIIGDFINTVLESQVNIEISANIVEIELSTEDWLAIDNAIFV